MIYKVLWTILIISLVTQFSYSFYYSSSIINENNSLYLAQNELSDQQKKYQKLENSLTSLISLENIEKQLSKKEYIPIKNELNLTQK